MCVCVRSTSVEMDVAASFEDLLELHVKTANNWWYDSNGAETAVKSTEGLTVTISTGFSSQQCLRCGLIRGLHGDARQLSRK